MFEASASRILTAQFPNLTNLNPILIKLEGTESISASFVFNLILLIEPIEFGVQELLNQPINFQIQQSDQTVAPKQLHGLITQASLGSTDYSGFVEIKITVKPWLALLNYDCIRRVYHKVTIPELFIKLCRELDCPNYQFELTKTYSKFDYLTQYDESYYAFIQRILEVAGIYYYFSYQNDKHVLVLTDNTTKLPMLKSKLAAEQLDNRQQVQDWAAELCYTAKSNCLSINLANKFILQNSSYLVTELKHVADTQHYQNNFQFLMEHSSYQPLKRAKQPIANGMQMQAVVMGQTPAAVNARSYTDIKVKFPWEHNAGRWMRLAQISAGAKHGAQFTPRVGEKVVVSFECGNPNQPLVNGMLYNASLPVNKAVSGFKTRSIGVKQIDHGNELSFNDTKDQAEIYLQAQKKFTHLITGNELIQTNNNHKCKVSGGYKLAVHNSIQYSAHQSISINAGNSLIELRPNCMSIKALQVMFGMPSNLAVLPAKVLTYCTAVNKPLNV